MTLDELLDAAIQGIAESQYVVGILYANGLGVDKDVKVAEERFLESAQSGFAAAQYELSLLLQSKGEENLGEAVGWLRKSALEGFPPAQHLYSLYCEGGIGTVTDLVESYRVCLLAADRDYRPAVRRTAAMVERGIGTAVDLPKAFSLYFRAAKLGDADAAASVGRMYSGGTGVEKNDQQALQWLEEGERRGSPWGAMALSSVYRFGELGQTIDTSKADAFAKRAQALIELRAAHGTTKV